MPIKLFIGTREREMPLGIPRRRWKDMKMDLQETECDNVEWIHVASNIDHYW
jgi:hypothetical protein